MMHDTHHHIRQARGGEAREIAATPQPSISTDLPSDIRHHADQHSSFIHRIHRASGIRRGRAITALFKVKASLISSCLYEESWSCRKTEPTIIGFHSLVD
jgi:hypothetical protein